MKTVRKIFIDDIVSLSKNFFALVIVIGICFLPALYAWFNIYSNWDPYGNTGALKMAVYSEDKGYTKDGKYQNQGESIIEELHNNTSVDWQFVDSKDDAINGVYSGKYYAAVVIDEKFTYSMYNVFIDEETSPTLHFYQNQKKNPVANKISDTVVSTLQNNINEKFISVVISEIFSNISDLYDDMKEEGGADTILENLKNLNANLSKYESTIDQVIASDELLIQNLADATQDTEYLNRQSAVSAVSVDAANKSVGESQLTLKQYSNDLNAAMDEIEKNLYSMKDNLEKAKLAQTYSEMLTYATAAMDDYEKIQALRIAIDEILGQSTSSTNNASSTTMITAFNILLKQLGGAQAEASEKIIIESIGTLIDETIKLQNEYNNNLVPKVDKAIDDLEDVLGSTSDMLNAMSDTFGSTTVMFEALSATLESADVSLEKTNEALAYVNVRLSEAIEKAEQANTEERMKVLVDTLAGDPEMYGKFFSEPVHITTEAVYPIENYGSAVAPFYTTLAIWVGSLILTAIIKVHPDKKKYPDATNAQLYFGRLSLFWVLGQLQALVIVLGDIILVGIQCVEPGYFFLAASAASTTFTMLIYSLVVTWGDVGKALAVVIVVLQIAGSSGTYPIELLPEFFQKVYIFFPFPYAINAMRECTCGMYEHDYTMYLLSLGIFMIVSLGIGLLLKIPFEEINHYMEERMEETEMM